MNKVFLSTCISLISCIISYAQVSLVKDINPGTLDGVSAELVALNGKLIFVGNDNANNYEIWSSEGSETNTLQLHDIISGNQGSSPQGLFNRTENDKIYFYAFNGTNVGIHITDGTPNGLIEGTPNEQADLFNPIELNGFLIFGALLSNTSSRIEPYALLDNSDFNIPYRIDQNGNLNLNGFWEPTILNNTVFYRSEIANTNTVVLCATEFGAGPPVTTVINNGNSFPSEMIAFNNKIYFSSGSPSNRIWVTDGTIAGTNAVSLSSLNPKNLTIYNGNLYFTGDDGINGIELYEMDTSENISILKDINIGSSDSSPFGLTEYNGSLYFAADDGINGIELWKSDGSASNTILLKDINSSGGGSMPQGFVEYNGELYFNADDGINGKELWKTDGTEIGTVLVDNINPLFQGSDPLNLTVVGNNLFFSAITGSTGRELFKYIAPSLSINDTKTEKSIKIYPNPVTDNFTIKTNSILRSVAIYNIHGKIVKEFENKLETYSISELNSGIYFIKIRTNKSEHVQKLIKY